jgi:hypothetical protein
MPYSQSRSRSYGGSRARACASSDLMKMDRTGSQRPFAQALLLQHLLTLPMQPFPLNPSFNPKPPLSNNLKQDLFKTVQKRLASSDKPESVVIRELAQEYNLSMDRLRAIIKLKVAEEKWVRAGNALQTKFAKGMEAILGVPKTLRKAPQMEVEHGLEPAGRQVYELVDTEAVRRLPLPPTMKLTSSRRASGRYWRRFSRSRPRSRKRARPGCRTSRPRSLSSAWRPTRIGQRDPHSWSRRCKARRRAARWSGRTSIRRLRMPSSWSGCERRKSRRLRLLGDALHFENMASWQMLLYNSLCSCEMLPTLVTADHAAVQYEAIRVDLGLYATSVNLRHVGTREH